MTRTVVVTGGCGYIGSHVARAFKMNGYTVYIIDNVKRDHTLKDIDGYLIDDFASTAALSFIINLAPDAIVHCAGTSLVGPSIFDPGVYYNNNIVKTVALLDVINGMPKKPHLMFSSSASVYGDPGHHNHEPLKETSTIDPISPYGNTKAMTERILQDYAIYGISSTCFRYFNAAGAEPINFDLGQEPGATHIIARVLEASINKKTFTINGEDYLTPDGTCVRDYVHVWDIATAHIKADAYHMADRGFDLAAKCDIYNLGTNKGISNKEIAMYAVEHYGLPHINYGQHRLGDPGVLVADSFAASHFLKWTPQYSSLETIMDSAYKWYVRQ
jgi:UDP-glucose 4-epimerase